MPFLTQVENNWKLIGIVAVLAVIVGAGTLGYLRMIEEEFESLPVDIPEKVTEDEFVDWLTYKNEKYGIEFKYPNSWILDHKEALSIKLPDQTKNFIQINVSNGVSGPEDESMSPCQPGIASTVYQVGKLRDSQQTFEEFVNFQIENPEKGMPPAVKPKIIQSTIGGYNALKIEEMINDCKKEFYYVDQGLDCYTTISFIVDKNEDGLIIDQMLSTFSFVEIPDIVPSEEKIPELTNELVLEILGFDWDTAGCSSQGVPGFYNTCQMDISKKDSYWTVTVTYDGLYDDSIKATRTEATIEYKDGRWIKRDILETQQCWPGRGHQDFSPEYCF